MKYKFEDNETFINTFDEMPLWSAYFGILLLKHLELKPNLTVIDSACGTGLSKNALLSIANHVIGTNKLFDVTKQYYFI